MKMSRYSQYDFTTSKAYRKSWLRAVFRQDPLASPSHLGAYLTKQLGG